MDAPLPVLLSRVLGHRAAELEADAGVGAAVPSLAVWSNVLRCVVDAGAEGIDEKALPHAARTSRRLAISAVTGAARRGWIVAEPSRAPTSKSRHVVLADPGLAAAELWPVRLAALDAAWAGTPLRTTLEDLVGQLALELPHFPASYGTADPSAIGGPFMYRAKPGTDGLPAHGTDWRPVLRGDGDTVSSLPLTALLSQALMAFTIDYEAGFPWPLASTLTVLCHLSPEAKPLTDVPGDHGVTGNGKSLCERHLIVAVTRDPTNPRRKLVALTDRGQQVIHHHPARLDAVEAEWRRRYGDATVTGLRDALVEPAALARDRADFVVAPLHLG